MDQFLERLISVQNIFNNFTIKHSRFTRFVQSEKFKFIYASSLHNIMYSIREFKALIMIILAKIMLSNSRSTTRFNIETISRNKS